MTASVRLPFVEMFGFDGSDAVLEESFPVLVPYAPTQARTIDKTPINERRRTAFEMIPRLSEVGTVTEGENTGNLVARLWDATDGIDALEGSWSTGPTSHASRFGSTDRRWGLIGAVAAGIIAVVVAATWLSPGPDQGVDVEPVRTAVADASTTVGEMTTIAGYLADPFTDGARLSQAAVTLAVIDRTARDLSTAGSVIAASDTHRDAARATTAAADRAFAIEQRLGDALTYRLVSDTILTVPELLVEANGGQAAQLGFDLAAMQSDAERGFNRLPRDTALIGHRSDTAELIADLAPLVDRYLEALRDGDSLAARAAGDEINRRVAANKGALRAAFSQFATEITEQAMTYGQELGVVSDALDRLP